jgi:hypothetical protein
MTFFKVHKSCVNKEVGDYPQIGGIIVPTTINDSNYIGEYTHSKAPENVFLPKCRLSRKAKKTDLVSGSQTGLAMNLFASRRLSELIQQSRHFGVQFFRTSLIDKQNQEYEYDIIHAYQFGYDFLDLKNCIFVLSEGIINRGKTQKVFFNNGDEIATFYANRSEHNGYLTIDEVAFLDDVQHDFFAIGSIPNGGLGYFVSEKLRNQIEEAGCTGIVFKGINEAYP